MSWLESHQELRDHPKTARLRRRLGVSLPAAVGHLHLLWWWALDYAPTGHLGPFDADVIADAACWEDDPGVFVRALIGAGFLNDDMTIHDWEDYAGRLIDRREANAKRMREARKLRRSELLAGAVGPHRSPSSARDDFDGDPVSGARGADGTAQVSGTFAGRGGLPDLTGPDHTGPDRTATPQPPPHAEGARPPTNGSVRSNPRRRRGGDDAVGEGPHGGAARRAQTAPSSPEVAPADLAPATDADRALWARAAAAVTDGWLEANARKITALVPLGRDAGGALWLRSPPEAAPPVGARARIGKAMLDAGDAAGAGVRIVEG